MVLGSIQEVVSHTRPETKVRYTHLTEVYRQHAEDHFEDLVGGFPLLEG